MMAVLLGAVLYGKTLDAVIQITETLLSSCAFVCIPRPSILVVGDITLRPTRGMMAMIDRIDQSGWSAVDSRAP